MKSFTDLKRSKKLAEILPLESADMHWQYIEEDNGQLQWFYFPKDFSINQHDNIPCWSLSALYDILPNNKKETTTLSRGGWKIEPIEYLDNWWCEYEDDSHTKDFTVTAENPIDACYEMILKLHERKML